MIHHVNIKAVGIHCGLRVRCVAPKREFIGSNLCWIPKLVSWYINMRHCEALSMVLRNYS